MQALATAACAVALLLSACAGAPPAPDWQGNARGALERAVAAHLRGETRVAEAEFANARSELGRAGRPELLARAALVRCAAQVASMVFEPCIAFDALRADATAADRAYADYLAGRVQPGDIALLPPQHRAVAADSTDPVAALRAIEDPLARLVAAGVLFNSGRASPAVLALAAETASEQGWRRPLLAWLGAQRALAEKAGDLQDAARLQRRMDAALTR
jgi:hypothetical protein